MVKRVTYLIGAGASANALPVVNGLNDKFRIFVEELRILIHLFNKNATPEYRGFSINELEYTKQLIDEILEYQTIDTFAKKQYLKQDIQKYEAVKNLLSCFLIYEQLNKKGELYDEVSLLYEEKNYISPAQKSMINNYVDIQDVVLTEEKKNLRLKYFRQIDTRYESLYASILEVNQPFPVIPNYINFISWNYDMQFELAYKEYCSASIDYIQETLNVYPNSSFKIDNNKSSIIKLNGTGNFLIKQSNLYSHKYDFTKLKYDRHTLHFLISQLSSNRNFGGERNQLKFAWESDEHVAIARQTAQEIIGQSDVIVIIGYSFPTFNREVDREIFKKFDNRNNIYRNYSDIIDGEVVIKTKAIKKIYIQDMPDNALKIKERLKAIGSNLFDIAETYDEVDQFFIPPEL